MNNEFNYLLAVAIILFSTKLMGGFTKKINLPQVVGALVAGILIGPTGLGIIDESSFIIQVAEIGVIMLMFMAGIDTDFEELKKCGLKAAFVGISGLIVSIILGAAVYWIFFTGFSGIDSKEMLRGIFIGVIIASTSVSITIEALREMGKLKGELGTIILGAAIVDDVLGILALTVISSLATPDVKLLHVVGKIGGYFLFLGVVGFITNKFFNRMDKKYVHMRRIAVYSMVFCLLMAWISEVFFGIADITGAYFAGLILCNITENRQFVAKKFAVTSYMFFSPIFFASIGVKTSLSGMNFTMILFAVVLTLVAMVGKIIGCGGIAKITGTSPKVAMAVGIGMISRGEVSLVIAQKGAKLGLVSQEFFPAIVIVVIATALLTPIMLKFWVGHTEKPKDMRFIDSSLKLDS
ncbi:MAG: cation:proton antiporter [Filifactoraceae bacterium]